MIIFVLEIIPEIRGRIDFYKLKVDNICEFDLFIGECKKHGGYESDHHASIKNPADFGFEEFARNQVQGHYPSKGSEQGI